jgi:reactive intermediate/imine deaminase
MKQNIQTDNAPKAIGTYSQAIKVDNTVYLSGQIGLDPKTMELVSNDFSEQAEQVMKNIIAVADAVDCNLDDVVKFNVYLMDMNDFAKLNKVFEKYLTEPYPARAAIQVSALPKGALIEIDGVISSD